MRGTNDEANTAITHIAIPAAIIRFLLYLSPINPKNGANIIKNKINTVCRSPASASLILKNFCTWVKTPIKSCFSCFFQNLNGLNEMENLLKKFTFAFLFFSFIFKNFDSSQSIEPSDILNFLFQGIHNFVFWMNRLEEKFAKNRIFQKVHFYYSQRSTIL